jgi:general secretion pathway protein D
MQIAQDVSRPGAIDPDISRSGNPPINNKTVSTEVAVQSGQTVFLGGLISESATRGRSGVPFLSRVPIIGPLFGSRSKSNNRSETLVMITPTVVENSIDLQHLSEEMQEQFSRVPPLHISPLFKDKAPEKDGQ